MQNNILLGQFDYEAVKKMHIKLHGTGITFDYDEDITVVKGLSTMPYNIESSTAKSGKVWVVCAESDKTAVLNALGYPEIQTVMDCIVGEGPYFNNLRNLTDCHYKIALEEGMNEYEAAKYALDKLGGYMMDAA